MARRLTRSSGDRMIFGVAGGLGEYWDVDPLLVRVAFVLLACCSGVGLLAYVAIAIVAPVDAGAAMGQGDVVRENLRRMPGEVLTAGGRLRAFLARPDGDEPAAPRGAGRYVAGAVLIAVGVAMLAANVGWLDWASVWDLWPVLVIAAGAIVVVGR